MDQARDDLRFADKVALVTGGARGIGAACCRHLVAGGARVAVHFRAESKRAEDLVAEFVASGGEAIAVQGDVTKEDDVRRFVKQTEDQLGPVDLLVNSAGILDMADHQQTDRARWQRVLDVNLTGTWSVIWAVKDGMLQRRSGSIVNIASIAGLRPRPQAIAYAASKAAVISLTQSLAIGLAGHRVRINAVAPGLIATEMIEDVNADRIRDIERETPMGRLGTPDDIAEVVAFLLSDAARFMTGQTLTASGGRVQLP